MHARIRLAFALAWFVVGCGSDNHGGMGAGGTAGDNPGTGGNSANSGAAGAADNAGNSGNGNDAGAAGVGAANGEAGQGATGPTEGGAAGASSDGGAGGAACSDAPQCDNAGPRCAANVESDCTPDASGCLAYSTQPCTLGCAAQSCATGCLEWLYDGNHSPAAYLKNNIAYAADSGVLGQVTGSSLYFADGSLAGWAKDDGNLIYAADGSLAAKRQGSLIVDAGGGVLGFIEGGIVYDSSHFAAGFIDSKGGCHSATTELLVLVLLYPIPF